MHFLLAFIYVIYKYVIQIQVICSLYGRRERERDSFESEWVRKEERREYSTDLYSGRVGLEAHA